MTQRSRLPMAGVLLAVGATLIGCTPQSAGPTEQAGAQAEHVVQVARSSFDTVISLPGTVVADLSFQVTAPVTGVIASIGDEIEIETSDGRVAVPLPARSAAEAHYVSEGDEIAAGYPLVEARYTGFALRSPVRAPELLRLTSNPVASRAQVDGSSAPFDCELLDMRPSVASINDVADAESYFGCAIPDETRVVTGMTGLVVVVLEHHDSVLTLPVEAVAGSVDNATVFLQEEGRVIERQVELGGSNGYIVEIRAGLKEGDGVVVPSPTLLE